MKDEATILIALNDATFIIADISNLDFGVIPRRTSSD
jgi:hypothetical protein